MLFTLSVASFGVYSVLHIPVGAVPDITNNQVQVITVSENLSTQDVEQFITYFLINQLMVFIKAVHLTFYIVQVHYLMIIVILVMMFTRHLH